MTRDELIGRLQELKPWLAEQGVANLRLFGSFARDEAGPESDVDLLVDVIREPMGAWEFLGIERKLGDRLGRQVEFCSEDAIHRLLKPGILSEAIPV